MLCEAFPWLIYALPLQYIAMLRRRSAVLYSSMQGHRGSMQSCSSAGLDLATLCRCNALLNHAIPCLCHAGRWSALPLPNDAAPCVSTAVRVWSVPLRCNHVQRRCDTMLCLTFPKPYVELPYKAAAEQNSAVPLLDDSEQILCYAKPYVAAAQPSSAPLFRGYAMQAYAAASLHPASQCLCCLRSAPRSRSQLRGSTPLLSVALPYPCHATLNGAYPLPCFAVKGIAIAVLGLGFPCNAVAGPLSALLFHRLAVLHQAAAVFCSTVQGNAAASPRDSVPLRRLSTRSYSVALLCAAITEVGRCGSCGGITPHRFRNRR